MKAERQTWQIVTPVHPISIVGAAALLGVLAGFVVGASWP
jgi:hypothetical protein